MATGGERPTVTVHIVKADITKTNADVGVTTVHHSGDMRVGELASAVLRCAGDRMQEELELKTSPPNTPLEYGKVITVNPYGLGTQYKLFKLVCLQYWNKDEAYDENLMHCVMDCLNDSAEKKYKSIMIPTLGMGFLNYPPEAVAVAIFRAIRDFSWDQYNKATTSLTNVYICLYGDKTKAMTFIKTFIRCVKGDITQYQPRSSLWERLLAALSPKELQPAAQVSHKIVSHGPPNFTMENTSFHFKIGAIDHAFENSPWLRLWLMKQAA